MGEDDSSRKLGLPIEEPANIRYIDSILGIALAISAFETNVIINILPDQYHYVIPAYAILVVISTLPGLIGILRRSWPLRSYSWLMTIYLLLSAFSALVLIEVFLKNNITVGRLRSVLIINTLPTLITSLVFWHVIRYAYLYGLPETANSQSVRREIEFWCEFGSEATLVIGVVSALGVWFAN
jgi:hypothetical protein